MGDVHKLIVQHGAEAVRRMDFPRAVVDAAAGYMSAEERDLFLFTGWAQAALPHRKLEDSAHWEISNDHVTLIVQPGLQKVDGDVVPVGVPYGSRARLILLYLQTEALRLNSREVELGRSMNHWLSRLGVPLGGEGARSVRDQANRLIPTLGVVDSIVFCPTRRWFDSRWRPGGVCHDDSVTGRF